MASSSDPGLHYLHPLLPYDALLPSPLRPGVEISIQGKVPARTRRFSFNLQKGAAKKADISFHFNPRFDEGPVVVRNARSEGTWGEEHRTMETEFPFPYKADFCVVFQANEECYKVLVNGQHFIDFNHRVPLDTATHLCIKGEVKIYAVHILMPLPSKLLSSIPGNLKLGDIIQFTGKIPSGGNRFKANIQCGCTEEDDVVLHFNPRPCDSCVVLNSLLDKSWGEEETGGSMPFTVDSTFTVAIAVLQDRFQVFTNGNHFANYAFRCPVENSCAFLVDGDVELHNVIFESPAPKIVPPAGGKKIKPEHILVQEFNPLIPSTLPIPGALAPGRLLLITGYPTASASRFEVNLQTGPDPDANISLHFNPRFSDKALVRNARLDGSWGGEEREGPDFPFEANTPFDLVFKLDDEGAIQIWFNGTHIIRFTRREEGEISHVNIDGDVFVKRVLVA